MCVCVCVCVALLSNQTKKKKKKKKEKKKKSTDLKQIRKLIRTKKGIAYKFIFIDFVGFCYLLSKLLKIRFILVFRNVN